MAAGTGPTRRGTGRSTAPAAPTPLGSGFAWLPGRVSEGRDAELAAALDEQIARLRDALAALGVTPETNGTRGLVVTGFSQGGIVALGLALRAPDLVATALPSAAFLPPRVVDEALRVGPGPAGWPPIRGVHGEADDEVPVGPARAMFHRLTDAGVPATLETFPGAGHRMTPPMHARKGTWLREAVRQLSTASPASS